MWETVPPKFYRPNSVPRKYKQGNNMGTLLSDTSACLLCGLSMVPYKLRAKVKMTADCSPSSKWGLVATQER